MESVYLGFAKNAAFPNLLSLESNRYEYLMPFYKLMKFLMLLPNFFRNFIAGFLDRFTSEKRIANRLRGMLDKDHEGINALYQRWDSWRIRFDNKWRAEGIDALITPCQYHAAFKSENIDLSTVHDYYLLFNFLHFPAGVVPVTAVREEEA